MKKLIFILMVPMLAAGCATKGIDLTENGNTQIEVGNTDKATVVTPKLEQYGDQVVVRGRVAKQSNQRILKGFVKIDVIDANGIRVDTAEAPYRFRGSPSRKSKSASFSAKLNAVPPVGSTVVIDHKDTRKEMGKDTGAISIM